MVRISDPIVTSAMPRGVDQMFPTIHESKSIYIPIGAVHRLANPGAIPGEQIEVRPRPQLASVSRLALALVEAAVKHLLGDAIFQNLHRATGNHPAAGCRTRGEPSGCHETKQALERGSALALPHQQKIARNSP